MIYTTFQTQKTNVITYPSIVLLCVRSHQPYGYTVLVVAEKRASVNTKPELLSKSNACQKTISQLLKRQNLIKYLSL